MTSAFSEIYKNWYKSFHLFFYKHYDYQTWEAGTSGGVDSLQTNKIGISDAITLKYVLCKSVIILFSKGYDHQILT